jgi:hypothetical protein
MAKVTGSFTTYDAAGNREGLADFIANISPTDTPFLTAIEKTTATNVLHEWQTDALDAVNTTNAVLEGDEVSRSTAAATARLHNYCQISRRDATVSGTQRTTLSAGREDELAYQIEKRSRELKRDMEAILTRNQGETAGNATTPRKLRALESWLSTNANRGVSGANATAATASPTDGTQRDITEAMLKDVMQKCFNAGGQPTMLMVGPVNKQKSSTFAGRSYAKADVAPDVILGAASLYASDFGDIKIQPNRFQRERTAFLIDPRYAAVAFFRPFTQFELAKVGDADSAVVLAEYTLEMRNEAAHGVIADLNVT